MLAKLKAGAEVMKRINELMSDLNRRLDTANHELREQVEAIRASNERFKRAVAALREASEGMAAPPSEPENDPFKDPKDVN